MSTQAARARLAEAQAALTRALAQGTPVPAGFDIERVQEAARALLSKRRRWLERTWPRLAAALGDTFRARFEAWARNNPMALEASPWRMGAASQSRCLPRNSSQKRLARSCSPSSCATASPKRGWWRGEGWC